MLLLTFLGGLALLLLGADRWYGAPRAWRSRWA